MGALLSIFTGSKVWTYLIGLAAIAAAVFFFYEWAHTRGVDQGIAETVAKYQPQIDKFNQEEAVRNATIAELEQTSASQAEKISLLNKSLAKMSTDSTTKFIKVYPKIAASCGVSQPTADAYNQFLNEALQK